MRRNNSSRRNKVIQQREWRVALMRCRGEFLGYAKAATREGAENEAARLFSLTEFQRRALLLQERL